MSVRLPLTNSGSILGELKTSPNKERNIPKTVGSN